MNTIPHPGETPAMTPDLAGKEISLFLELLSTIVGVLDREGFLPAADASEMHKGLCRMKDALIVLRSAVEKAEAWASSRRYQFEGVCGTLYHAATGRLFSVEHDVDQHLATVECKKVVRMGECPHCTADAGEHCIDLDGKIVPAHKTRPWSS